MSRLVDVDKITDKEISQYLGVKHASCTEDIRSLIDEQPTAFDAEKVIEQLEEESKQSYEDFESYAEEYGMDNDYEDWFFLGLVRAIEIVKRGGRDEE